MDDDRDSLQILATMLSEHRAKVQTAASAAEALQLLEWYELEVLVSDLANPGEDGFSLIGKSRSDIRYLITPMEVGDAASGKITGFRRNGEAFLLITHRPSRFSFLSNHGAR